MPTPQKEALVAEIREKLEAASAVLLADYRGLTVKEMQEFRARMREVAGELKVYKNSLTAIAVREAELPELGSLLEGPSIFAFTGEDPVAPAKALVDFAKSHPALEVKGGLIEGAVVDAAGIKALAALPSKEELIAKLLGTMQNPIANFMRIANAPAAAFVRALQAVADQKAA